MRLTTHRPLRRRPRYRATLIIRLHGRPLTADQFDEMLAEEFFKSR